MSKMKIQVLDDAPLVVIGEADLLDGDGNVMKTADEFHLCRCGLAKDKPYCDGSHVGKFESKVRA
ncbi:MAG: CDGSH iron-sulfur domain-containing protein [Tissierellaceae bacterium]|nr:CDGSH iron-sulfur domain-containing protein [Tissierellaceae bacterium]